MQQFDNAFIFDHPLIQHKTSLLRDKNTSTKDFRELVSEISMLMAYEVTRDFELEDIEVEYETKVIDYSNAIVASTDIGSTLKAVIIDELPAKAIAEGNDNLACWKIDAEMESYVLYFNKEAGELIDKVNAILDQLLDSGVIDYLTLKHTGGIV